MLPSFYRVFLNLHWKKKTCFFFRLKKTGFFTGLIGVWSGSVQDCTELYRVFLRCNEFQDDAISFDWFFFAFHSKGARLMAWPLLGFYRVFVERPELRF